MYSDVYFVRAQANDANYFILPSSVNTAGRRGVLFYHLPVHIHIFTLTVFMAQDVKQLPSVLMVWGCFTCQTGYQP